MYAADSNIFATDSNILMGNTEKPSPFWYHWRSKWYKTNLGSQEEKKLY